MLEKIGYSKVFCFSLNFSSNLVITFSVKNVQHGDQGRNSASDNTII